MIKFTDRASIGGTKVTQEGYLIATSRVARTGVQSYYASEIGDAGKHLPADQVVRVYRHADSVFAADTLASLTRVPVTLNHPDELVTAENWKDYAVGELGDAFKQDGDWIVVQPMLKDSSAIAAAGSTHKELSMGYTAEIVVARDGIDADFEQVNIRMNHLALVPRGRAGAEARIGDSASKWGASPVNLEDRKTMVDLKTVVLGDKAVQVEAKDADTVAAILKDHATALAVKDKEIGELTVKLADAEKKVLTDAQIKELVAAKAESDMKRKAVKAHIGDAADAMSDAQIEGAYAVLGDAGVDETMRHAIKDKKVVVDDTEARIAAAQLKFYKPESK